MGYVTDTSDRNKIRYIIFSCGSCHKIQLLDIDFKYKDYETFPKKTFIDDLLAMININFFNYHWGNKDNRSDEKYYVDEIKEAAYWFVGCDSLNDQKTYDKVRSFLDADMTVSQSTCEKNYSTIMLIMYEVLFVTFDFMIEYHVQACVKLKNYWINHTSTDFGAGSDRCKLEQERIKNIFKQIGKKTFEPIVLPLIPNLEPKTKNKKNDDDTNISVYDYDNDPVDKLGYINIDSKLFCAEWTLEAFRFLLQKEIKWPENFLKTYAILKQKDISTDPCNNGKRVLIETSINQSTVEENIEISDDICIILSFSFIGDEQQGHYGLLRIHKSLRTVKVYETGSDANLLPYFPHIREILIKRQWDTEENCNLVPWYDSNDDQYSDNIWYVQRRKMKSQLLDENCGPMAARMLDRQVDLFCFKDSKKIEVNLETCRVDVVEDFRSMISKHHAMFKGLVDETFWKKHMFMTLKLCNLNKEAFDSAIKHTCFCQQTSQQRIMVSTPCCNKRSHWDCLSKYLGEREEENSGGKVTCKYCEKEMSILYFYKDYETMNYLVYPEPIQNDNETCHQNRTEIIDILKYDELATVDQGREFQTKIEDLQKNLEQISSFNYQK